MSRVVPSIKAETANELFANLLKEIQPEEATIKLYKEILSRTALNQLDNLNHRLGTLRSSITNLENERNTAIRRWNSGGMSDEEKNSLLSSIDADRIDKREQLEALEQQQLIKRTQINYIMNFMGNAYKLWIDADVEMRQRF